MLLPERAPAAPFFSKEAFRYDPVADAYTCPGGATLPFRSVDRPRALRLYRAPAATCAACPLRSRCPTREQGRRVTRAADEGCLDRVRAYQRTEAYHKARRKRSKWVEPLCAEAKGWHSLRRCRLRRLWRVNVQVLWTASGQNLKRLLAGRGWGRRPFPTAPGLHLAPAALQCPAC